MGQAASVPLRRKACWGFFCPEKSDGLNSRTWVPKASTLPLDHRSHLKQHLQDGVPNWEAVGLFNDVVTKFMNAIPISFMLQASHNTLGYVSVLNKSTFLRIVWCCKTGVSNNGVYVIRADDGDAKKITVFWNACSLFRKWPYSSLLTVLA